ncbi:MAG TPA: glycosyltransferase [Candidatus Korarchaeota archaeon]|nr:glycosyltransferase [Candidatus Korarchaeota archaeon]
MIDMQRVMRVSLICTVKNEERTIAKLIRSIAAQSRMPDEIVIVDGGSRDATVQIILQYRERLPIKLLRVPGTNIAQGRNIAIRQANGEIIVSTDAGCVLDKKWLENLVKPIEQGNADVVGGWYIPDSKNWIEECIAIFSYPLLDEVLKRPEEFLPSGRSIAFRKEVWEKVGGYPEKLETAEDTLFDIRIKKAGFKFKFEPKALVYWRPRSSIFSFFKQQFKYSKGNAQAGLYISRYLVLVSIYTLGIFLVVYSVITSNYLLLRSLPLIFLTYTFILGYRRILDASRKCKKCILIFPILRFGFDFSRILGFFYGRFLRLKRK